MDKLIKIILHYGASAYGLDPFRIYQCRESVYRRYNFNHGGGFSKNKYIRIFIVIWLAYIVLKYLTLTTIQMILYQYSYLGNCTKARLNLNFLRDKMSTSEEEYDQGYVIAQRAMRWGDMIGNPFYALPGISYLIYLGLMFLNLLHFLIIPYYYKKHPMDARHIRLLLEPDHEIARVDIILREQIHFSIFSPKLKPIWETSSMDRNRLVKIHEALLTVKPELMRPVVYTREFHSTHVKLSFYGFITFIAVIVPYLVFLTHSLYRDLRHCISRNFHVREQIAFFEIATLFFSASLFIIYQALTINIDVIFHIISAADLKRDMQECIADLKALVENHSLIPKVILTTSAKRLPIGIEDEINFDFNKKLLQTYIKLRLTDEDIKGNNTYVTNELNSFLIVIATTCMGIIIAWRINSFDLVNLRISLLIYLLVLCNVTLCGCVIARARWTEVNRIGYSLLANLAIKSSELRQPISMDFIATYWIRLVRSNCLSDDRMSMVAFNLVSIDFKTLLSINLLFITLASML